MSSARLCFLIIAFAVVAVATVHLRSEQTRCAAELANLESKWVLLRREWWDLQTRTARLRSPTHIRGRVERLRVDLVSPESQLSPVGTAKLASDVTE